MGLTCAASLVGPRVCRELSNRAAREQVLKKKDRRQRIAQAGRVEVIW
jgi:hypothetical protein